MNVKMRSPADEEKALQIRLSMAFSARERGRLHAALAVCAGRSLAYRRMNYHEDASAQAYARKSKPLQDACNKYNAAIAAFSNCDNTQGMALLRQAQPVIVAELGEEHPYALQVTNTLAGRLRGEQSLDESLALQQWLVARYTVIYGASHTLTCQGIVKEAHLLGSIGDKQGAIAAFERAIDGLLEGPWPNEAGRALGYLATHCRETGQAHRTALLERRLFGLSPTTTHDVRDVFLRRQPHAARHFNAQALLHGAAHFPALSSAAKAVVNMSVHAVEQAAPPVDDESAEAAFSMAIYAFETPLQRSGFGDSPTQPALWVLSAMERLDSAATELVREPGTGCACSDNEVLGPLQAAEQARQHSHFEQLFRDDSYK